VADPLKSDSDQYLNDLRDHAEERNVQARTLQCQMAQGYWQVVNEHLGGGVSTIRAARDGIPPPSPLESPKP